MWFWQRPRSFKKWTFWEANVYAKWKLGNCFKGWFRITGSWENSTESCILPCVKQMTSANSMHEAGHPKLVLGDNLWVVWRGRWDTCTLWLIHVNIWQKLPQYCNVISLQLKKKKRITEWHTWEENFSSQIVVPMRKLRHVRMKCWDKLPCFQRLHPHPQRWNRSPGTVTKSKPPLLAAQ